MSTTGAVNGHELDIDWNVMKVTVPILSVRRLAKKMWNTNFREHDGYLKHRVTGARIPVFEHKGVYYLKYKITGINGKSGTMRPEGFTRQVP